MSLTQQNASTCILLAESCLPGRLDLAANSHLRAGPEVLRQLPASDSVVGCLRLTTKNAWSLRSDPMGEQSSQDRSPERFTRWAQTIGPHTTQLVQAVLTSRQHPQQAYRSCLGLLRLASRYSAERLEAACHRALRAHIHSYKGVKNILDAKLDQVALEEPPPAVPSAHANIRGQTYYR